MRRRQRHFLVSAVAVLAATTTIYILWSRTSIVPDQVAKSLTENLLREHGYRLAMDALEGSPGGDLKFVHPRLFAVADTSRTTFSADEVLVRLGRPWDLFRGRVVLERLRLTNPVVILGDPPAEETAAAPSRSQPRQPWPRLQVRSLEIAGARVLRARDGSREVVRADATLRIDSDLPALEVELQHASLGLRGDSVRINDAGGRFVWRGDSVQVRDFRLHTVATSVEAGGSLRPEARSGSLEGQIGPLDLEEVGHVAGVPLRAGRLVGPVQVIWRNDTFEVRGRVSGNIDTYDLSEVDFSLVSGPEGLELRRVTGRVNEVHLEVTAQLREGALRGQVNLADVDLRRLLPDLASRLPEQSLAGRIGFERRSAADTLRLDVRLASSRMRDVQLDRVEANVGILGKSARIHRLLVESPLGRAEARGRYDDGQIDMDFELDAPEVTAMSRLLGVTGLTGDVYASGHIAGPMHELALEADLTSDRLARGGVRLWSTEVSLWAQQLGPRPLLDVELRADSLGLQGQVLRLLSADLAYADGALHILRSQASTGDTLVAAAGTVQSLGHDWTGERRPSTRVRLETMLLQLGGQEIRIEDPATLWLRGQAVHLDSLRLVTRGGVLRLDGGVDAKSRVVGVRAEIEGFDLGFLRRLIHLEHELEGTGAGWIEARGTLDATLLDGHIAVWNGAWNNLRFDSLQVAVQSDARSVEVRHLRLATPEGDLSGTARLGYLPALERWLKGIPGSRSRADLASAEITARFDLDDLQLESLWKARSPAAAAPAWRARLTSTVHLTGTISDPKLEATGAVSAIHTGNVQMGALHFGVGYAQDRLVLRDVEVSNEGQSARVEGVVPLHLDFFAGASLPRDQPLSGRVLLPRGSFALLWRYIPTFESPPGNLPAGEVEARLDVSGTLAAPQLQGELQVDGASFVLRDMEEVYRDVYARGTFSGKRLQFTEIRGTSGGGKVSGSGWIDFEALRVSTYDLRFRVERLPVLSIPEMSALVSGNLQVRGRDIGAADPIPDVRGTLDVLLAEITQEFDPQSGEAEIFTTDKPEWLSDLELRAPKGHVWVKNSQVDAELAGNVQVVRTLDGLDFKGLATLKRGNYTLPFVRFELRRGELDFSRHPGLDPEFDIEAQSGRSGERTYVALTGHLKNPRLTFWSDRSELTSEQIQQELVSVGSDEGAVAIADIAEQTIRDLRLLPHFSIDPAQADSSQGNATSSALLRYNISAGRAISDRIFLIYTQGVYSDIQQRVAVEIDINRWLLMDSSYERRSISSAAPDQVQNAFDINLKYRHEY